MSKKTKKSVTHVFMIVDKSGSMELLATDVIGGFNSYVQTLAADTDHEYSITAVLFDTKTTPYCMGVTPDKVPAMDAHSYRPSFGTALYDAVGFTISNVSYVNPNDKVLVVIMTDGFENSSKEETTASINKKVKDREAQGWEFIYIGQGPDQWAQSQAMGMNNYVGTQSSGVDTRSTYSGLAKGTVASAGGASIGQTVTIIETEVKGGK